MSPDHAVVDFALRRMPQEWYRAFELLSGLDYPVNDLKTFRECVSDLPEEPDSPTRLMLEYLLEDPSAFPLASREGAFEKLYQRLPASLRLLPSLDPAPVASRPSFLLPGGSDLRDLTPGPGVTPFDLVPGHLQEAFRRLRQALECAAACDLDYKACMADGRPAIVCEVLRDRCRRTCGLSL